MSTKLGVVSSALLGMSLFAGCNLPGKPEPGPEVPRPETVTNFDALYGNSCAGCHGAKGQNGAAMNLANPEYQALVDDATLKDIITNGEKGTLMPAFGQKQGGELTDEQIDALVKGMRQRWNTGSSSKGNVLSGLNAPPWKATHEGDVASGQKVYASVCAQCHGESAQKPGRSGSILDGSFLAVVNEQMIRTTVIAGRPDLGMPDWRSLSKDHALTDNEVTDVTAWLMSQKPALPGQPYGTAAAPAVHPAAAPAAQPAAAAKTTAKPAEKE